MNVKNETSPQLSTETEQILNQLSESCPLSDLLGKQLSEASDDELDSFIDEIRVIHESPASLKKYLNQGKAKPKGRAKPKVQLDLI